jgi:hypothetical protein
MGSSPAGMNWKTFSLTLTNEGEECLGQLPVECEITPAKRLRPHDAGAMRPIDAQE